MAFKSAIEWTDATWNPWHGCHKVSAGCKNCYMFRDKKRYGQDPNVVVRSKDATFYAPLKWSEPRTIFTCSWSDFFIEEADPWRDEAFAIMALTPQHTYQVLTKRPDRMLEYFAESAFPWLRLADEDQWSKTPELSRSVTRWAAGYGGEVLDNVWLGVSVEDQNTADERIPLLLKTPAAKRFLSVEPLLGPVHLSRTVPVYALPDPKAGYKLRDLDWLIAGGESGPDARPTHPDWIRSIRDQCQAANVPFHFKQWGEWAPSSITRNFTREFELFEDGSLMYKVGKKQAGRLLDGREHNEMPDTQAETRPVGSVPLS